MVDKAENSHIPEYLLGTENNIPKDPKDRDHLDKILDNKLSQVTNNHDKKESSSNATSSFPRYV